MDIFYYHHVSDTTYLIPPIPSNHSYTKDPNVARHIKVDLKYSQQVFYQIQKETYQNVACCIQMISVSLNCESVTSKSIYQRWKEAQLCIYFFKIQLPSKAALMLLRSRDFSKYLSRIKFHQKTTKAKSKNYSTQ